MHHHDWNIQDAKTPRNSIQSPASKHKSLIEATTENTHNLYVDYQNNRQNIIYSLLHEMLPSRCEDFSPWNSEEWYAKQDESCLQTYCRANMKISYYNNLHQYVASLKNNTLCNCYVLHLGEWQVLNKNGTALKPRQVWILLPEIFVMVKSHAQEAGRHSSNKTCKQPLL
jgi:hypothetical protein